jgi:hypothetical protein
MAEPRIMSPREYGLAVMGYAPGQTIEGAELDRFEKEYETYRKQAVTSWQLRSDAQGKLIRANPATGLVMDMTNAAGQPVMAGTQDPFAAYMGGYGGVAGAAPAAADDMTNSMAFQGVQPSGQPAAAGNPVMPVNVNPAAPAAAPSPSPTAAAAKVYQSENDVIADARAGYISKEQAQQILVNQFGLDP